MAGPPTLLERWRPGRPDPVPDLAARRCERTHELRPSTLHRWDRLRHGGGSDHLDAAVGWARPIPLGGRSTLGTRDRSAGARDLRRHSKRRLGLARYHDPRPLPRPYIARQDRPHVADRRPGGEHAGLPDRVLVAGRVAG